jgi:hypothetical protein
MVMSLDPMTHQRYISLGPGGQRASLSLEGQGLGNLHIGLGTLICDLILFIVHNYVVLHLFMSNVDRLISGQFGSVNYKQEFPTEGLGVDCRVFFPLFFFFHICNVAELAFHA